MDAILDTESRREYFRCDGVVYLRFLPPEVTAEESAPATMDHAGILLRNFRARLEYDNPDDAPYIAPLLECVDAMHTHLQRALHAANPTKFDFMRTTVNISGSGIAFFSDIPFETFSHLTLQIAFSGYPFSLVTVGVEVRHMMQDIASGQFRIACKYETITEADRDLIVKFVNYLQRQERLKQREQQMPAE